MLVVDDDPALRRLLESSLPDAGYQVQSVIEAQAALETVIQQPPDVILLDLMLPGMDGFTLCKQLREWTTVPIIMLTARAAEKDVVLGLQLGADDYVTKPFRANELIARIEAVLRRVQPDVAPNSPSLITVGGLTIDLAQRQITIDGDAVDLTPIEYQILTFLARHAGQVLTHSQILQEVWGEAYSGGEPLSVGTHCASPAEAGTRQQAAALHPDGTRRGLSAGKGVSLATLLASNGNAQPKRHPCILRSARCLFCWMRSVVRQPQGDLKVTLRSIKGTARWLK